MLPLQKFSRPLSGLSLLPPTFDLNQELKCAPCTIYFGCSVGCLTTASFIFTLQYLVWETTTIVAHTWYHMPFDSQIIRNASCGLTPLNCKRTIKKQTRTTWFLCLMHFLKEATEMTLISRYLFIYLITHSSRTLLNIYDVASNVLMLGI